MRRLPHRGDEVTVVIEGRRVRGRVDKVTTAGCLIIRLPRAEQKLLKVRGVFRGNGDPDVEILDLASLLAELA